MADIWVKTPVTATTINTAVASASAGDRVIIPDGTYPSLGQIKVPSNVDGTEAYPITLKAATPGGVSFTGNSASPLIFIQGDWWLIRDFKFIDVSEVGAVHTYGIRATGAIGTRVTNTYWEGFGLQNDAGKRSWCIWMGVTNGGAYSRIDNNTFSENGSVCLAFSSSATNCKVDHNYFKDTIGDSYNGFEGIHNQANYLTAEYNLFENMSAEPETISNKASSNTYRYNVFKNTSGKDCNGLVLRSGNNCVIDGNYFFGVSLHNIRVHGAGHKIINNYFENPGYSAILLAEGGVNYANVSDILIANNTIVNPVSRGLWIGWWPGGDVKPANLTFENNIITSNVPGSVLVRDSGHTGSFVWESNLHYATGGATYWHNDGGGNEPSTGITHATEQPSIPPVTPPVTENDVGVSWLREILAAEGRIVSLTYPASIDHGAMCDINAAIKNIGELSGRFKTQILINSILLATSPEFTLAGGATSSDKIDPFKAPLSGESMDIIIKCIRSE